jgi:tRNA 2-selenouridine synthase
VVVSGLAGAGKTELLGELERDGEQVLDLEALAGHRGSAFGAIGLGAQPSHAAFARAVADRVAAADPRRALWVEDEGPFIGSVGVPPWLAEEIAGAPVVELHAPFGARVARLDGIYGSAPAHELLTALERSRRRLGAQCTDAAQEHVRAGDVEGAIVLVLPWFDVAYRRRVSAYGPREVLAIMEERSDVAAW